MNVSIICVRAIVAELSRRGVSGDVFLQECGIDPMALSNTLITLPLDRFEQIVGRALSVSDAPDLALAVGAAPQEFQLMAQFAAALPTLRDAIDVLIRYTPIFSDSLNMELSERAGRARFSFEIHAGYSREAGRFCAEMFAALCVRLATQNFTDSTSPQRARFIHPAPCYAARYREALGCAVEFDSPEHCIDFDAELLDRRQPRADTFIVEILSGALDALLSAQTRPPSRAHSLRQWIAARPDLCSVQLRTLCRSLGVSERVLRRQLHREGTSFARLLNEVRVGVAIKEMRRASSNLKQVSARLGYSEVSSFHRAFKRWTGMTPVSYLRSKIDVGERGYSPTASRATAPNSDCRMRCVPQWAGPKSVDSG